jgi:ADP-ribose pyrophosphatase YjhB (NUDIX family)
MNIKKPVCLRKVKVAENEFVQINMDILKFPDGSERSHIKVSHQNKGGVVIVVLNDKGELYAHSGYHYAADTTQIEFIRGFCDKDESIVEAAERELHEEILFEYTIIKGPILIGEVYPDSTILSCSVSIFVVYIKAMNKLDGRKDRNESLGDGVFYELSSFEEMICGGEISDGFTLAAYVLAKAKKMITNASTRTGNLRKP